MHFRYEDGVKMCSEKIPSFFEDIPRNRADTCRVYGFLCNDQGALVITYDLRLPSYKEVKNKKRAHNFHICLSGIHVRHLLHKVYQLQKKKAICSTDIVSEGYSCQKKCVLNFEIDSIAAELDKVYQLLKKKAICSTDIVSEGFSCQKKCVLSFEIDSIAAELDKGRDTEFVLELLSSLNKIQTNDEFLRRYPIKEHIYLPLLTSEEELKLSNVPFLQLQVYTKSTEWTTCEIISEMNVRLALTVKRNHPKKQRNMSKESQKDGEIRKLSPLTDHRDHPTNQRKTGIVLEDDKAKKDTTEDNEDKKTKAERLTNKERTRDDCTYFNQKVCLVPENEHVSKCSIDGMENGHSVLRNKEVIMAPCNSDLNWNLTVHTMNQNGRGTSMLQRSILQSVENEYVRWNSLLNQTLEEKKSNSFDVEEHQLYQGLCSKDEIESRHSVLPNTEGLSFIDNDLDGNLTFESTKQGNHVVSHSWNRIRRVWSVPISAGCTNGAFHTNSGKLNIPRVDFACITHHLVTKQLIDGVQNMITLLAFASGSLMPGIFTKKNLGFHHIVLIFGLCCVATVATERSNCLDSLSTMTVVNDCPKNEDEWDKREKAKQCETIKQTCTTAENDFKYHCLLNEWGNSTVEVCAEARTIICHCAEYNTGAGIVQHNDERPFSTQNKDCIYQSNTYKFHQQCTILKKSITVPPDIQDKNIHRQNDTFNETQVQINRHNTVMEDGDDSIDVHVIIAILILTFMSLGILFIICIRRRRHGIRNCYSEQKEEEVSEKMISNCEK